MGGCQKLVPGDTRTVVDRRGLSYKKVFFFQEGQVWSKDKVQSKVQILWRSKKQKFWTRTIIVHRSVDGIIIDINIYSARRKDGKKSRRMD